MWAMIVKEFRELRRDRRTLAMMIVLPVLMLVIFGYAANFTVSKISTLVVGPQAQAVSKQVRVPFQVVEVDPTASKSMAETWLRDNKAAEPGKAFQLLDAEGLVVQARGDILRVPAPLHLVEALLDRAHVGAKATVVPANLEEAFVDIVSGDTGA